MGKYPLATACQNDKVAFEAQDTRLTEEGYQPELCIEYSQEAKKDLAFECSTKLMYSATLVAKFFRFLWQANRNAFFGCCCL